MELPACWDPVYQEERRQLRYEQWLRRLTVCDGCGRHVMPGEAYSPVELPGRTFALCRGCLARIVEDVRIQEGVEGGEWD